MIDRVTVSRSIVQVHYFVTLSLVVLFSAPAGGQENTSIAIHVHSDIEDQPQLLGRVKGQRNLYMLFYPDTNVPNILLSESIEELDEILVDGGIAEIDISARWDSEEYRGNFTEHIYLRLDESDLGNRNYTEYHYRDDPPNVPILEEFLEILECDVSWRLTCDERTELQCTEIDDPESYVLEAYYLSRGKYREFVRRRISSGTGYRTAITLWYHTNFRLANMTDSIYRIERAALENFVDLCVEEVEQPDS